MVMHREFVPERAYESIEIGETASITKTITESDVINYAGIIGDFNPLHANSEYAKTSMFEERICHGMLTASFISTLVGCGIPGKNGLYLSQEIKFVKPVKIGDTITATAEVIEKIDAKRRIIMSTIIKNQHDEVVIDGKAVAMVMKK
ncbi:MaoC family dehydratase [Megasphaera vaginalis (ex Bordigoni et al. 2020)]|uniref:MaoC family dehydratase n=1 Tax=Megasphaera vaginalis (ex Bordigoni et al. 2020) TaxID=2045301 RepID=UPI001F370AF7|nr:MaoC family dehydratase [Megasphaera vaginalis (ex Bordigoni et al. 2020)]